jgi:hypothetical protein
VPNLKPKKPMAQKAIVFHVKNSLSFVKWLNSVFKQEKAQLDSFVCRQN